MNKPAKKSKFKPNKKVIILSCVAVVLLALLVGMLVILSRQEEPVVETQPTETTAPTTEPSSETTEPTTEEPTTEAPPTEPGMLEHMAKLYQENPDIVGWIKIEGTKVDYPLMYTPDEYMKYLYMDFKGQFSPVGLPFIDVACSLEPESTNLLIHGHNMKSGAAFAAIMNYEKQEFYEEHPTISLTTLYEERTYEIVAAFHDRIRDEGDEGFIYYQFIEATSEAEFIEAAAYYRAHNLINTGIELEYGDHIITLATCSHRGEDGRFVVIARLVTEETENP